MFALILMMSTLLQTPGTDGGQDEKAKKVEVVAETPEKALRTFYIAMLSHDEKTLRAVTVETDDLDVLLRGKTPPADQIKAIKELINTQPIRKLKVGEIYPLPGGRTGKVEKDEVSDTRAVLLPEGSPMPLNCHKVDDSWQVDATPLIEGRKSIGGTR